MYAKYPKTEHITTANTPTTMPMIAPTPMPAVLALSSESELGDGDGSGGGEGGGGEDGSYSVLTFSTVLGPYLEVKLASKMLELLFSKVSTNESTCCISTSPRNSTSATTTTLPGSMDTITTSAEGTPASFAIASMYSASKLCGMEANSKLSKRWLTLTWASLAAGGGLRGTAGGGGGVGDGAGGAGEGGGGDEGGGGK